MRLKYTGSLLIGFWCADYAQKVQYTLATAPTHEQSDKKHDIDIRSP